MGCVMHPLNFFVMEWLILPLLLYGAKVGIQYLFNQESAATNQGYAERNLALQEKSNLRQMEAQHELNIEDWEMNNEYNLPKNQLARYTDAGLSPAAAAQSVAGAGSLSSVPAGSSPGSSSVSPGTMIPPQLGSMFQDFKDVSGVMLDKRRVSADERLKEMQAYLAEMQASRIFQLLPYETRNLESETLKNFSEIRNNQAAAEKFRVEANKISEMMPFEREKLIKETDLLVQKIDETKEAVKNLKKQRQVMQSQIDLDESQRVLNEQFGHESEAREELTDEQKKSESYRGLLMYYESNKKAVTDFLVQTYHINPEDDFYQQIIESAAHGEQYGIEFIRSLSSFADGCDEALTERWPHYKSWAKGAALLYGAYKVSDAYHDQSYKSLRNLDQFEDVVLPFMNGGTPNPIGFRR